MANQVTIYTKNHCPYCVKAKNLLNTKKVKYSEINIENSPEELESLFERTNGMKTFPQIFIKKHHIGGCDNLIEANANGELDKLLNS